MPLLDISPKNDYITSMRQKTAIKESLMKNTAPFPGIAVFVTVMAFIACGETNESTVTKGVDAPEDEQWPHLRLEGRTYSKNDELKLFWTNSGFSFNFTGTGAAIVAITSDPNISYLNAYVDGALVPNKTIQLTSASGTYILAENLPAGSHTIRVVKRNQPGFYAQNIIGIKEIQLMGDGAKFNALPAAPARQIEFVGDSITSGQGNLLTGGSSTAATEESTLTYTALTSKAFGAANQSLSRSGIKFVRATDQYLTSSRDSITDYYAKTAQLPNLTGSDADWGFTRQSDVVVINLGTNDSGQLNNAASGVTAAQLEVWYQAEAKALLELVRRKNPKAVIIWCYGMMGENSRVANPVKAAIEELGDGKIFYLKLTDTRNGVSGSGGEGHPTVPGNILNSYELVQFLAEKTGWKYSLDPQIAAQLYWADYRAPSLNDYTGESSAALTAAKNTARALIGSASATAGQVKTATDNIQGALLALEFNSEQNLYAYVNADTAKNESATAVITGETTAVVDFGDQKVWKLSNQNHGFGVRVDNTLAGYQNKRFTIEIEYYMPTIADPPREDNYAHTRLCFRYNPLLGNTNSSNVLRRGGGSGVAAQVDTWAVWTINLTDAAFRRGINENTDFNIIKWGSGDDATNGIDYVYIRSITVRSGGSE